MNSALLTALRCGINAWREASQIETMPGQVSTKPQLAISGAEGDGKDDSLKIKPDSRSGDKSVETRQKDPLLSAHSPDELPSGDSSSTQRSQPDPFESLNASSPLFFGPELSSASGPEQLHWRRYDPPKELQNLHNSNKREITDVLKASIERVITRNGGEEEEPLATAGQEVALAGGSNASALALRHLSLPSTSRGPGHSTHASSAIPSSSIGAGGASESDLKLRRIGSGVDLVFIRGEYPAAEICPVQERFAGRNSVPILPSLEMKSVAWSSLGRHPATSECISCLENHDTLKMVRLACHSYCKGCFRRLVSTALESEANWPPKCCQNTVATASIMLHLDSQIREKYSQRAKEWSIPAGARIYCPQPACSTWIPPNLVKIESNTASCPTCSHEICAKCRNPTHGKQDCAEDFSIQATIDLAGAAGWKRCYQCRSIVEHNYGCRHITCRCKAEFCYICTKKWKTCDCRDSDLDRFPRGPGNIRQEAAVQAAWELAEAEEARAAIQQVEHFKRAEHARLALEAYDADVERRRRETIRQRREEKRTAPTSRHFRLLHDELEVFNKLQRSLLDKRHSSEDADLTKARQDALSALGRQQQDEQEKLEMSAKKEILDKNASLKQEHQDHLTEQKAVLKEYRVHLFRHWEGKPQGKSRIREVQEAIRKERRNAFQRWKVERRERLDAVVEIETEKLRAHSQRFADEREALNDKVTAGEERWERKKWAENQWMDKVRQERIEMLQEMERGEYVQSV